MTLEETLASDPIRSADNRAGTPSNVLDHPGADPLEILSEVEFGDCALAFIRPKLLVGAAQGHSHDHCSRRSRGMLLNDGLSPLAGYDLHVSAGLGRVREVPFGAIFRGQLPDHLTPRGFQAPGTESARRR